MTDKAEGGRQRAEGLGFARGAWLHFRHPPSAILLICALAQPAGAADVSNIGRGTPAAYVKVTGTQIQAEGRGDDLHIRVREVRLETTGKLPAVKYTALGVAVSQRGKLVRANWDFDVRGELSAAKPSVTFAWQEFVLPQAGKQCEAGGCEVRLQLRVEPSAGEVHAEHTDFAAVAVTWAPAVAQRRAPPAGKPGARPGQKPDPQARAKPGIQPPPPKGPPPPPRQPVDREIDQALAALGQERRAEADKYLQRALDISIKGRTVGTRHPLAAQLLFSAAEHYERMKAPRQQELALLWSLTIVEPLPPAEVRRELGAAGGFDKEKVARRLGDFYWQAKRYDRAFQYYDRAYRHVADLGLQPPTANVLYAFNSAGRMATACMLGKWDVADAAMKELKERAPRVDASTRQQLDYWIRTGEPRLAARKC